MIPALSKKLFVSCAVNRRATFLNSSSPRPVWANCRLDRSVSCGVGAVYGRPALEELCGVESAAGRAIADPWLPPPLPDLLPTIAAGSPESPIGSRSLCRSTAGAVTAWRSAGRKKMQFRRCPSSLTWNRPALATGITPPPLHFVPKMERTFHQ